MDLSHLAGIESRDIPVDGQSKGESGIGHWRKALNGNCVTSTADAKRIAAEIFAELNVKEPIAQVLFAAPRKNLRGHYHTCPSRITLYGHPRLATLLHEIAHHVTRCRFGRVPSHGKQFKRSFIEVFRAFGAINGVDMNAAAMAAYDEQEEHRQAIKINDLVRVPGGCPRIYIVVGFGRTRLKLKCQRTREMGFSVNPNHVEVVGTIGGAPPAFAQINALRQPLKPQPIAALPLAADATARPQNKAVAHKVEKVAPGSIVRGDRVENKRKAGSLWTVTMVDGDRLECEALTDDSNGKKKLPIGRVRWFSVRTMRRV